MCTFACVQWRHVLHSSFVYIHCILHTSSAVYMRNVRAMAWASVSPCTRASQTVSNLALHSRRCNQRARCTSLCCLLAFCCRLPKDAWPAFVFCILLLDLGNPSEAGSALRLSVPAGSGVQPRTNTCFNNSMPVSVGRGVVDFQTTVQGQRP